MESRKGCQCSGLLLPFPRLARRGPQDVATTVAQTLAYPIAYAPCLPTEEAVSKLGILDFCTAQVTDYSF
jgi:hypothetical protein